MGALLWNLKMKFPCWKVGGIMAEEEKGCCEPWEAERALPDVGLALAYPDVNGVTSLLVNGGTPQGLTLAFSLLLGFVPGDST